MTLKNRLSKLEQTQRRVSAEADCICFPPEETPHLELQPEIEAAKAVRCPLHGERFKNWATRTYRVIGLPAHLARASWRWRSAQYIKAMDASFPPDRWPAKKIVEPDGTVRFVLKDGTAIHRLPPPQPVYDYTSGELAGFVEDYPPKFKAISAVDGRRSDWEQPS
jgi:hypothetical protein